MAGATAVIQTPPPTTTRRSSKVSPLATARKLDLGTPVKPAAAESPSDSAAAETPVKPAAAIDWSTVAGPAETPLASALKERDARLAALAAAPEAPARPAESPLASALRKSAAETPVASALKEREARLAALLTPADLPPPPPLGARDASPEPAPITSPHARSNSQECASPVEDALAKRDARLAALATSHGTPPKPKGPISPERSPEAPAEERAFAVGDDVEVSLADDPDGRPAFYDCVPGVVEVAHGDGTYDVSFDSGERQMIPGDLLRPRPARAGDVVAVEDARGLILGAGTVAHVDGDGMAVVVDEDENWRVPVAQLRRLSAEPLPDSGADEPPAQRMTWLGDFLCGCGTAVESPSRSRAMSY